MFGRIMHYKNKKKKKKKKRKLDETFFIRINLLKISKNDANVASMSLLGSSEKNEL